jgi:hypothetical protein
MSSLHLNYVKKNDILLLADPCGKRGITWTRYSGFSLLEHNDKQIGDIKYQTECRRLCLQETDFICRSFELIPAISTCYLSKSVNDDFPLLFVRWPGYIYEDWACDIGNYHLQIMLDSLYTNNVSVFIVLETISFITVLE